MSVSLNDMADGSVLEVSRMYRDRLHWQAKTALSVERVQLLSVLCRLGMRRSPLILACGNALRVIEAL
jgi:hypothetical protein